MTSKHDTAADPASDWALERLAAGDLSGPAADRVRRRLSLEPGGEERLARLTADNAAILSAYPAPAMADQIRARAAASDADTGAVAPASPGAPARAGSRGRRHLWAVALGGPTLALATLAVALWVRPELAVTPFQDSSSTGGAADSLADRPARDHAKDRAKDLAKDPAKDPAKGAAKGPGTAAVDPAAASGADDSGERIKGLLPALHVYRQAGEAVERLRPDAPAHAGDRLQLAYVAAGRRFGAVLSVDGAGQVTFHLPAGGGPAARLRSDGEVALPEAYELDAAPGYEQFVFFTSNVAFQTAPLADVVRGGAPAPARISSVSFRVRKE